MLTHLVYALGAYFSGKTIFRENQTDTTAVDTLVLLEKITKNTTGSVGTHLLI